MFEEKAVWLVGWTLDGWLAGGEGKSRLAVASLPLSLCVGTTVRSRFRVGDRGFNDYYSILYTNPHTLQIFFSGGRSLALFYFLFSYSFLSELGHTDLIYVHGCKKNRLIDLIRSIWESY